MNIPETLLQGEWYRAAWVAWALVVAFGMLRAPWSSLKEPGRFNIWLGMVVLLIFIWQLKAGVKPGLEFHFMGAALLTLSFGPWLAFFALSLILAGVTFNGTGDWRSYGLNALLGGGMGVLASHAVLRIAERFFSRNLFVYIFTNGFFGAGAAVFLAGLATAATLMLGGVYTVDYLRSEYVPYLFLLSFSEAWLTGMMVTLFVIYRPDWIATFDDALYLTNKQ